ncbi:helix-turn-helix domain-containing protein [Actinophytocola algeriensis]|jgi:transcriptional regulator with XRE-family HTH domain|uniref:Transcriptional regulator with XRE-family HTH domain n=1 Tax=Actinophytocola algeriensis TaxID=1768010 RepID=A0A7W7VDM8_9PSEU|nr:helix-turn-helix domain-containing protein [Actinophytocola algeriensis]MBB4906373.1 transcriptional regulator with XRE-family HTH domain [Actinophytocola algeriensis]MBE1477854.1 transcriptional regulator with XRE-family HTH domain [Actinophytocola algeriensis]
MGRDLVGTADETFADMVQRWRHMANLTQEGLAARSGLSPRSIQNLERGRVGRPRRASVRLLADALGLTGADRAAFVHAARIGTPTPITAWRGGTDSGEVTAADNLRQLVAQARRTGSQPVDLRGLPHTAAPDVVLERLLTALGIHEADAVTDAVAV